MQGLELWGGPECTINRVGETYRNQLAESGHEERLTDLDMFADLGLAAIRYPALWERMAPDGPGDIDWRWVDERLPRLRALGVRPIVGLVHHGSGPRHTNLLEDSFAPGLADYAGALAERHPWIDDWTPVNEPVTTARFSALYGLWYPHHRDERSFWLALINQIDGTRLAMERIRQVNPRARLIQTDDLGRTYATSAVRDQAAFNNVRRWMGWDLLCGRVVHGHPMWRRLCDHGFGDRLTAIADQPCPPDIIGVNHYLTSDRFLDHRVQRYPSDAWGGGPARRYADTEAVRVLEPPPPGLAGALSEAWERYGIPIAITEVHNGCTREEQMRWMAEAWQVANRLREQGVDICAVTSWALLGSHGWNTLLTGRGDYEPGAFDVRSGTPQPTAMVDLLKGLTSGAKIHPGIGSDGWWRRPIRFAHPVVPRPAPIGERCPIAGLTRDPISTILIAGLDDEPARQISDACRHRGLACHVVGPTCREALEALTTAHNAWAVIGHDDAQLAEMCAALGLAWQGIDPASPLGDHADALDRLIDGACAGQRSRSDAAVAIAA